MITVIIGFTGQGKSTLALSIAQRCVTRIIIDPRKQFQTTSDVVPDEQDVYDLLDDRYEVIVQPGRGAAVEEVFDRVCGQIADWIEDNPQERICVICDEGRLLGLESKGVSLNFDWIIRSAREGSPIDVIITCHRPVDVSTNIRAIANRLIYFPVMLPSDLVLIEDQCGPACTNEVKTLLDKQFVTWNNSRQQWKRFNDPASWFIKISEAPTVGYVNANS